MSAIAKRQMLAVMGPDVMSQSQGWKVYDRWLADGRIVLLDKPVGIEAAFRMQSRRGLRAPKDWADSYLPAFA